MGKPGVKPGRAASCLPGTCAVGLLLARGRLMAFGESTGVLEGRNGVSDTYARAGGRYKCLNWHLALMLAKRCRTLLNRSAGVQTQALYSLGSAR